MNFTLEHDIVKEEQQSFTPLWVTTARTNSFKALRDLLQLRAHALRGGWECHICCIGFMCSKSTYTFWEAVRCRVHQMNLYISYSGEKKKIKRKVFLKNINTRIWWASWGQKVKKVSQNAYVPIWCSIEIFLKVILLQCNIQI